MMFPIAHVLGSKKIDIKSTLKDLGYKKLEFSMSKTGPKFVYHLAEHETTISLGIEAINRLECKCPNAFSNVEVLVSVTETPELVFPGNAAKYASTFDINTSCELFDINSGCTGFLDALSLVLRLGKKSIIVCSEAYSKHMNQFERSTLPLFSDGAAAVYIDPSQYKVIDEEFKYIKDTSETISSEVGGGLKMAGPEVYLFTQNSVMPLITRYLNKYKDITVLFAHQGSLLVVDSIKNQVGSRNVDFPTNIVERGNVVSATLPILMDDYFLNGNVVKDGKVLLVGFGVGLQIRAMVLEKN
jgi:3-oxoacyl-[acyl-carrier-protein] synthase-3